MPAGGGAEAEGAAPRTKEEIFRAQRERQRRREAKPPVRKKGDRTPWWLRLQRQEAKKRKKRRPRPRPPAEIERGGVIRVWQPDHPRARGGRVPAQDLVMEEELGRHLNRNETVLHVNGDRKDNRPDNLHLCPDPGESARYRQVLNQRLWEFLRTQELEEKALRYLKTYDERARAERQKQEGMEYVKEHGLPRVTTPFGSIPVMPGSGAWCAYGFNKKMPS